MSDEGINSGFRNVGRFFLALIPWALGIGAVVWLGFWVSVHEFRHQLNEEKRAATYVGAPQPLQEKIVIQVKRYDCTRITKADVDGTALLVYAVNDCKQRLDYTAWHWELRSPDNTAIAAGYENWKCPTLREPNETAECRMKISDDERAKTLRVWTQKEP